MKTKQEKIAHYDQQSDALSLIINEGIEDRFEEIKPGVFVEFDKDDRVIGFEILEASKVLEPAIASLAQKAAALHE